ncbi:hypothetical protein A2316_01565 [Candidatus Falkowbacteria bacterium RIFOXYB2_FULL_38_15]|uniref:Uncharacterized protein n=1 Tax=Candidatus Falkowbacteria bacterium RIFOXYA2_FULL_38_12 TaxID=1797993 RepID=A0A1F5S1G9_9BACT|nr:MAG: hypothetical protein A2257_03995 [Candidatus Falkowbacteria bacterium RIFOXYA2_FULL_38_12]OGF32925.1 MAG: hypothetical protein A2316_01565 [Candidatus Falkowbacteria bacterium RIFOXYB2_FULL_38_15]OGF44121.1 MAG: hypothetical protein A2555_01895 [Candidatus Falkowbacteria bacterium RIFOXYD2_FULL_39_16]
MNKLWKATAIIGVSLSFTLLVVIIVGLLRWQKQTHDNYEENVRATERLNFIEDCYKRSLKGEKSRFHVECMNLNC